MFPSERGGKKRGQFVSVSYTQGPIVFLVLFFWFFFPSCGPRGVAESLAEVIRAPKAPRPMLPHPVNLQMTVSVIVVDFQQSGFAFRLEAS